MMIAAHLAQANAPGTSHAPAFAPALPVGVSDQCNNEHENQIRGIYRLPQRFLGTAWPEGLGAEGTRLLHALLHLTCYEKDSALGGGVPLTAITVPLSVLRDMIGPRSSNDARAIHRGVTELRETDLFEKQNKEPDLKLRHGNRLLTWRFTKNTLDWLFADELYGLLDIRTVSLLRRPLPIMLYSWFCMIQRMHRPQLLMEVDWIWSTAGCKGALCWTALSRSLLRDLQLLAAVRQQIFVLHLNWRGHLSGIDEVGVSIVHAGTQWPPKVLCKSPPVARQVVVVTANDVRRYAPAAFRLPVAEELCRAQRETKSPPRLNSC